jgi:hypothetical protein
MGTVTVFKMLIFSVSESKLGAADTQLITSKAVWFYSSRNFIMNPTYI